MRYTLVCSAAGTGLSDSIEKLKSQQGADSKLRIEDVETRMCESSALWDLKALGGVDRESRSMAHVCSKLPRGVVSHHWREALFDSLKALEDLPGSALALACHLTLFSPNRREYYVPGRPQDFLAAGDGLVHEVARVVVLIDDIYDMYARLSIPGEVFDEERHTQNYNDHYKKLSGQSLLDPDSGTPELLKLEVRRRSLESLAAWRRTELIQAEALASALGNVPLTVLGVKHHLSALESLILKPETPVAYLSHKISEARRHNKENPGEWLPFVYEVNSLSHVFKESGIILLHPTAIDELRTASAEKRIGLTDRWPLQEESRDLLIYCAPDCADGPEYTDLLGKYEFEQERTMEQAMAIFRGFELGVFHDIAFRDHLLVSSTNGLVLYRPVVLNGEDSGGARAEVVHWLERWVSERAESAPRLVAMHVFEDIDQRLRHLRPDERTELFLRIVEELQEQQFDREQARSLVEGGTLASTHLQEVYSEKMLEEELENAAGIALVHCFLSWLCNVRRSEGRTGATLVAAESADQLRSPEMVREVSRLLRGEEDAISTTAKYLLQYAQAKGHETHTALAQHLIRGQESPKS